MRVIRWLEINRPQVYLILFICFLLISSSCAAPATPSQPPSLPAPAEFEVTSLAVTPIVAEPGQAVTVEVEVKNVGGTEGSHTIVLTVNGVAGQTMDVTVKPFVTETAAFTLIKDASSIYDIEVSGLTETLRVKQPGTYPRLINMYCGTNAFYWRLQQFDPAELDSMIKTLARWDIIVVSYSTACFTSETVRRIKELNPQAKILAYIEAGTGGWWRWLLTHDLEAPEKPAWMTPDFIYFMRYQAGCFGISVQDSNESFFLHYGGTQKRAVLWTNGTTGEEWPGMNPNSEWATYLPQFVHDKLMSTGLFDGVFYDCFWETMWKSNIDIDNDGVGDSLGVVNQKYKEGMTRLLQVTRELLGPEAIILGNPGIEWSANSPFFEYANGHMQECALGGEIWSSKDFAKVWDIYQRNMQKPEPPTRIHWIGVDTNDVRYGPFNPKLPAANLQKMRYGLAITLLDDGYFGFDIGNDFHGELWWFPEYDTYLGFALGDAQKRSDGSWVREFENGTVLANPAGKTTIEFATTHRDVTTGVEGTSFEVPPLDGRIFVVTE